MLSLLKGVVFFQKFLLPLILRVTKPNVYLPFKSRHVCFSLKGQGHQGIFLITGAFQRHQGNNQGAWRQQPSLPPWSVWPVRGSRHFGPELSSFLQSPQKKTYPQNVLKFSLTAKTTTTSTTSHASFHQQFQYFVTKQRQTMLSTNFCKTIDQLLFYSVQVFGAVLATRLLYRERLKTKQKSC